MEEVVSVIVEWLGSQHSFAEKSWRSPPYGWEWVVIVATWIGGWLTAQELRARKKRLGSQTTLALIDHELSATALVETEGGLTKHSARLKFDQQAYALVVKITSSTTTEKLIHEKLSTLAEVEAFLVSETIFILSDFKVPPSASGT